MSDLTPRDRELVALGAAMGSNCVPCVEYHITESRKAGLSDAEIHAAIQHADKIRQVPARKTMQAALNKLSAAAGDAGCGVEGEAGSTTTGHTVQPMAGMTGIMSKMMATCGSLSHAAGAENFPAGKSAVGPATSAGCGCG